MSARAARASKLNEIEPSSGLTVIVGVTLSPENTANRSLALNSREAISSWIVLASRSANFSRVGVLIRSIWPTSTPRFTSRCTTRQISDDLP